jgi:hypothetical protein
MIGSVGLFDFVRCEYPLPLPEEALGIDMPDWSEFDFQTKPFLRSDEDQFMGIDTYNIDEEGEMYKDVVQRTYEEGEDGFLDVKEVNKGIERVEYTGEMHLSGLHTSGKYDYFMEFEALFWKGDLKEIKLANWEKNDNEERLKKQKELEHRFKQAYDKKSSGFRTICNKAVKLPFSIIKYLFALGYRIAHKVESWISF